MSTIWPTCGTTSASRSSARRAFAHKGGIHVNAVEKVARSYEHIEPEAVGNHRRVLVSELSGRSNVLMKAHELGVKLPKDSPEVQEILHQLKQLEHAGYEFEAADASFHILVQKLLKRHKPFFNLLAYRVIMDRQGGNGPQHRRGAASNSKSTARSSTPWPKATAPSTRWTRRFAPP